MRWTSLADAPIILQDHTAWLTATGRCRAGPGYNARKISFSEISTKPFHFEPPISAQDGWKSYPHCSRSISLGKASLFENPADAFQHTYRCVWDVGDGEQCEVD